MVKKYIFFTTDIHTMGGAQNYVRSKIRYLKKCGWTVYTFFQNRSCAEVCAFEEMQEYVGGEIKNLSVYVGDVYGTLLYYEIMYKMLLHIQYDPSETCQYIIESYEEGYDVWAEFLAKKISAKHIYFSLQENFGVTGVTGKKKYLDFLKFKFERKEIAGIADDSLHRMFDGYMDVDISNKYKLFAIAEDNVTDIYDKAVETLERKEFNIAYMGRCEKSYFPFILYELRIFCKKYCDKEIQFIVIGELKEREQKLVSALQSIDNLTVSCLGYFNPIPRSLFKKVDVMIAGAGCATISHRQGVPVIVPNAVTNTAMGILGYTTTSVQSGEDEYSYCELLEDVLIGKQYLNNPCIAINRPSCEEAYGQFFKFVDRSEQTVQYYQFPFSVKEETNRGNAIRSLESFLLIMEKNPKSRENFVKWFTQQYGTEIALFGFGKIGRLLKKCVPELLFSYIFDNHVDEIGVEKPIKQKLEKVKMILITPYGLESEILNELYIQNYKGQAASLKDIVLRYLQYIVD